MHTKKISVLFYLLFILILASCTKPNQYFARERYVVTTNNLNIRIDPTRLSGNIGTLTRGDTIIALASDKYWVMIKVGNQTGFVSNEYIMRLKPITPPRTITIIERNANWKIWPFWLISIILITLWVIGDIGLMRYENHIKSKYSISVKKISISPLIFFVSGILTAILYLYWKDIVIESLFFKFSFLSRGKDNIAWVIWIQCFSILLGMIVDIIGSIYRGGVKYGFITFLIEQGINLIIFSTAFFLTISLFVVAIVFLVVFFATLYTIIVTENSKSFSGFINGK